MKKKIRYTAEFKTEVVIRLLSEEDILNAIAAEYGISSVMLSRRKKEVLEWASEVFARGATEAEIAERRRRNRL